MQSVLEFCVRADLDSPKISDIAQWRNQWQLQTKQMNFAGESVAAAAQAGFHAHSVAWAFLGGYQSAIRNMLSASDIDLNIADNAIVGFSVSEKLGNRPRDISTCVQIQSDGGLILNGAKSWVVAGSDCDWMMVSGVNKAQTQNGGAENSSEMLDIRLLAVAATDAGVSFIENPPTQFIPEVVHGAVALDQVRLPANRLLPGDGHQRYVKPFRTLEDIHIATAVLSYLIRCGREHQWPKAVIQNSLGLIASMNGLSALDPSRASTHLALTGVLSQLQNHYDAASACWEQSVNDRDAAMRWQRDRALFDIAKKTRQLRADRAWSALTLC